MVRKGLKEDISCIACLWQEMVRELAPEYTPNIDWWMKMANNLMSSGIYTLFVAENAEKEIIGFIDFFTFPEPATSKFHAVGQHFFVLPGYRKTSVSGRLYRQAVNLAKNQGCSYIELMCFDREKPFWEKKGFSPIRSMVRRHV